MMAARQRQKGERQRAPQWGTCAHHAPGTEGLDCSREDIHVDPGVHEIVMGLYEAGIATDSSCEGSGPPHASLVRYVALSSDDPAHGRHALRVAKQLGMPVYALVQVWMEGGPEDVNFWQLWFEKSEWRRK